MAEATSDRSIRTVAGGATAEAIGGIGAIVLTIIGLAHVVPNAMASIATIVVGTALLLEGGAVAARFADLSPAGAASASGTEIAGGMSVEVLGGIAGIVLGIIALIGGAPLTLVPVANIVFGGALMIGALMNAGINRLEPELSQGSERRGLIAHQAFAAASGTQVMVGIAATVLGILALLGLAPLVLSLVALLAVGTSVLLSGSALGGRVVSFLGR